MKLYLSLQLACLVRGGGLSVNLLNWNKLVNTQLYMKTIVLDNNVSRLLFKCEDQDHNLLPSKIMTLLFCQLIDRPICVGTCFPR